jgi:hypothetical protein
MFYIRTGDRLQQNARRLESVERRIKTSKQAILDDFRRFRAAMSELVGTWFREWEVGLKDSATHAQFKQFKNTEEPFEQIDLVRERNQTRSEIGQSRACRKV